MFPTAINTLRNEGDPQAILHHRIQDRNPHTESDRAGLESLGAVGISTHTLHTEGDGQRDTQRLYPRHISTHTLHTEGDHAIQIAQDKCIRFQPTPSTRRVTSPYLTINPYLLISTHTLHTEGDLRAALHPAAPIEISTHTLHTEGDSAAAGRDADLQVISTHTLHTEGDFNPRPVDDGATHFNPHPPHGG